VDAGTGPNYTGFSINSERATYFDARFRPKRSPSGLNGNAQFKRIDHNTSMEYLVPA
jgi:hypothetical protein